MTRRVGPRDLNDFSQEPATLISHQVVDCDLLARLSPR